MIELNREVWYYTPEGELAHHGIKGQKWGERNGPPYPLKTSQKSSAEKNSNPTSRKQKTVENQLASGVVSDLLPVVLPVVAYTATIAVAASMAKKKEKQFRKECNEYHEKLKNSRDIKTLKDAPKLGSKMHPSESMKITNPDFPEDGTTLNCTFCTTAMALREKGYDVRARKIDNKQDGMYSDDLFAKAFNSETHKITKQQMMKKLAAEGEGAYGNLVIPWITGGSHSVFWKNENGATRIYDGQSGMIMNDFSWVANSGLQYNRLDNCEPTEYALAVVERNKG